MVGCVLQRWYDMVVSGPGREGRVKGVRYGSGGVATDCGTPLALPSVCDLLHRDDLRPTLPAAAAQAAGEEEPDSGGGE